MDYLSMIQLTIWDYYGFLPLSELAGSCRIFGRLDTTKGIPMIFMVLRSTGP